MGSSAPEARVNPLRVTGMPQPSLARLRSAVISIAGEIPLRKTLICFWVVTLCSVASTALGAVRIIVLPLESLSKATSLRWLSEGVAIAVSEQLKVPGVDAVDRSRRAPLVEA